MRRFRYAEPGPDGVTPVVYEITEDRVLDIYFSHWHQQMFKVGKAQDPVTQEYKEQCIDDFCAVHWAVEIKE